MAYLLFIDESGQDQRESPYEVLAGIAVRDVDLWLLITQVAELELHHFGRRYSDGRGELKAKKILKRKTFRQASQLRGRRSTSTSDASLPRPVSTTALTQRRR